MGVFAAKREENGMTARIFVKLLPVQVAMIAMGSINSIVDGIVAARFIDPSTVGVVGLYYAVLLILEAAGNTLLGGVSVLSGKYLGSGRIDRTRGICSLGMMWSLIIGGFLTAVSLLMPGTIADILGASAELREPLITYVIGYAFGLIPQMLGQQIAATLQLERREKLGHAAITAMILTNIVLDILFVPVWKMGVWGLALATSLANWAYFLVVATHYLNKKAQLRPSVKLIEWRETIRMFQIGFPGALLVVCLVARSLVLNRLILQYSGPDGLSALASFNMISGLMLSVAIGTGGLVRMLISVFMGEENRESIRALIQLMATCMMALIIVITIVVVALAPVMAAMFYPDRGTEVFRLTAALFQIYGIGIPITLVCIVFSNYCQAVGYNVFVNLISVMDGFVSSVVPALFLAPAYGAIGVWWAFLIGLVLTMLVSAAYPFFRLKRRPKNMDEWLMLPPEFGAGERLVINVHGIEDVAQTAEKVQSFCEEHGIGRKTATHCGLCMEEIARNIAEHGFQADHRKHHIEVGVVLKAEDVVLRIKDDCIAFDPQEWHEMTRPDDPASNVGIRLVYGIAREVEYQNLLGLNVLTIHLTTKKRNQIPSTLEIVFPFLI